VPTGIGDLLSYLRSHPSKSAQVYLHNLLKEVPGRIPNNSGMERYPQVFPVILALAAVFASLRKWREESYPGKAVLLSPFLILLVLPVFTNGWWKYLVPYAPLLIILGCAGITFAAELICKRFSPTTARSISLAVMLIVAVYFHLMAFTLQLFSSPNTSGTAVLQPLTEIDVRRLYTADAEKAGRWIAEKFGPGHNYMVPWSKLIYHLDGLWTAAPIAEYERFHAFALSQGAECYLAETNNTVPIEKLTEVPPGLRFETIYRSPQSDYAVAVYKFIPRADPGTN
jgi:hypothetical protein